MIRRFINRYCDSWYNRFSKQELFDMILDGDFFRVYIYADELKIPVFHVVDMNTAMDLCICLFEPRFYQYNHNKETEELICVDLLDEFLRSPNEKKPEKSNWDIIVDWWMFEHSYHKSFRKKKQPNYNELETNKMKKRSFIRMLIAKISA